MFTGIITAQGVIKKIEPRQEFTRWTVAAPEDFLALPIGASICCSGACLTLVEKTKEAFVVEWTSETSARTNFSTLKEGGTLNLEKAMRADSTLDGHIVTGHIDGLAELLSIEKSDDTANLLIKAPSELSAFIAAKGSVALDGVSLTVNEVEGDNFTVMLIPHTLSVLGWGQLKEKYCFNIEVDLLSRYVARYLDRRGPA